MTKADIANIISIICPNDEDYEKPIISPAYLKKELETLALEQKPKTGHWIHHEEKMFISAEHWECSWCHRTIMIYPFRVDSNGNDYDAMYYCPKCGAKMESEE